MKLLAIIATALAIVVIIVAGYFFFMLEKMKAELQTQRDYGTEQEFKVRQLETRAAGLSKQLEDEIAKISKQKEEEIQRLASTQEQLISELQTEIDQKQVEIKKLADRLSVTMVDKILFPSGEADLTPAGFQVLQKVGNIIKNVEDKVIRVEGHTDNVPIALKLQKQFPTNWELAAARATNVVRFLQETVGIPPQRLQAVGLSEFHPVASNDTPAGRSKNRRIEIALLPLAESNSPAAVP
jgi:chemotaxis protein MotB